MLTPLSFTPEFRRKMAELPQSDRQEWLESVALRHAVARDEMERASLEAEMREVARGCRAGLVDGIESQLGPFAPLHLRALLDVPRERFVRPVDLAKSVDDTPLPLDEAGLATVSAPHAYLLTFRLLELAPGDSLLELGTGSGYGAALASYIVGEEGQVITVEIDRALYEWSNARLMDLPNVDVLFGDAVKLGRGSLPVEKIAVTFAVESIPDAWLDLLPEGGILVAPVGARDQDQRLVRVVRELGRLRATDHGAVRYVQNRSPR